MSERIALTAGEPAGIGPDLALSLAAPTAPERNVVVIADPDMRAARAEQLKIAVEFSTADDPAARSGPGTLLLEPVALATTCIAGQLDTTNAAYVLQCLDRAVAGCRESRYGAMVTGPVQKSVINDAGITFSGHTEYLAESSKSSQVVMMLACEQMRVALVTTHLPLSAVPAAIEASGLAAVIRVLHRELRDSFQIEQPCIAVLGLNPHAGEGGHMGREELDTIIPVLEQLRGEGMQLQGPLPADTAFNPKVLDACDAVLAMYHDQGLPVLKYAGFGAAVNITLGLPFIRTSVDHGTALELAGSGQADPGSLHYALDVAAAMARARGSRA